MAVWKEGAWDSPVKGYAIEVYEHEGQNFKFKQEIPLVKEDSEPFQGSKPNHKDYTQHGMLHKNSKMIVWCSG